MDSALNQKLEESKIIIYQTEDGQTQIDVRLENDTVWLTQAQMVELFQTTKQNVSLHVSNVFKEDEMEQASTVKEYLTVQQEGKRAAGYGSSSTSSYWILRKPCTKEEFEKAVEVQLKPESLLLKDVEADGDVRRLIHNLMELYEGTTIMNIVLECQREYQERYFSMQTNDWRHLIRDYVRKITERPELQETEIFRYVMAG